MNRAEYLRDLGSTAEARAGEAGEREMVLQLGSTEWWASSPRGPGSSCSIPCSPAPYSWAGVSGPGPAGRCVLCLPSTHTASSRQPVAVLKWSYRGERVPRRKHKMLCASTRGASLPSTSPESKCEQPTENHSMSENPQHPDNGIRKGNLDKNGPQGLP